MEVVDAVVNVPTTSIGPHQNVPVKPVVITKARVISEPPPTTPPAATRTGAPAPGAPKASAPSKPTASPKPKATPGPSRD
jgi:hypothetical protein